MNQIRAAIDINAPPARVWLILADFAAFPQRNPFIRQISEELKVGSTLDVPAAIRPTRQALSPYEARSGAFSRTALTRRLWGMPKLFEGEYSLKTERLDANRVRFVQQEVFSGILMSLLGGTLSAAERSFGEINEALKTLAEKSTAAVSAW